MGTLVRTLSSGWNRLWHTLYTEDLFMFLALPTVFTIYFYFGFSFMAQGVALLFLGLAVVWRDAVRHPLFWLSLWGLQSIDLWFSWIGAANHSWVMWYWGLVMLIASFTRNAEYRNFILQNNARWLLIIIMLVAVFWKIINPYYTDGSFFERNLVSNPLMIKFTHLTTGMPWEQLQENSALDIFDYTNPGEKTVAYHSNVFADILSVVTSWWVLLIELIIGVLLLLYRKATDFWAHVMHMLFIVVAYVAAPILGFAWILVVLGMATAGVGQAYLRPWYVLLFLLMFIYAMPWTIMFFNWLAWFPVW